MYDKLFGLGEATKESIKDPAVMDKAATLVANRQYLNDTEFVNMLFEYTALLASVTASMTTQILFTEEQMSEMLMAIDELDSLGLQ